MLSNLDQDEPIQTQLSRHQLSFLEKYEYQGLKAEDLHNNLWFNCDYHFETAEYLIRYHKLTPKTAIAELEGLSKLQSCTLPPAALRREDVAELTEFQLKAIYYGNSSFDSTPLNIWFKAKDFRGQDWFNDKKFIEPLADIARKYQNKLTPQEMIRALSKLDEAQLGKVFTWAVENNWSEFEKINSEIFQIKPNKSLLGRFFFQDRANKNINPENTSLLKRYCGIL